MLNFITILKVSFYFIICHLGILYFPEKSIFVVYGKQSSQQLFHCWFLFWHRTFNNCGLHSWPSNAFVFSRKQPRLMWSIKNCFSHWKPVKIWLLGFTILSETAYNLWQTLNFSWRIFGFVFQFLEEKNF